MSHGLPTTRTLRRVFRSGVAILGSLVLLGLVVRRVDLHAVGNLLADVHPGWFLAAAALGPLQFALGGLRWRAIAEVFGTPMSGRVAVAEYGLSSLLNQVLPGGVAGDAVRVWRRRHQGAQGAVGAAVVDRWIGLWVHVLVTALGAWTVGLGGPVVLLLVVLSAVAFGPGTFGRNVRRALVERGGFLVGSSAMLTATFLLGFGFAGLALGLPLGRWVLVVVPLVLLAMVVPVSVGGWGLREATAVALLPRVGWTEEQALAVSTVYGISALVGALPGGLALWMETE